MKRVLPRDVFHDTGCACMPYDGIHPATFGNIAMTHNTQKEQKWRDAWLTAIRGE